MSFLLSLSGNSTFLEANYYPPIDLSDGDYSIALLDIHSFNNFANITDENNTICIADQTFKIAVGSYEISDIEKAILNKIRGKGWKISISPNLNTLKCEINTSETINFNKSSIHSVLGFNKTRILGPGKHVSDNLINIIDFNAIYCNCSLVSNSFQNGLTSKSLHCFYPKVSPGYKLIEVPQNLIYLKVKAKEITSIQVTLTDERGNLLSLRGEPLNIRLHVKRT